MFVLAENGSGRKKCCLYGALASPLLTNPTAEKLKSDVDHLAVPFCVALYYIEIIIYIHTDSP